MAVYEACSNGGFDKLNHRSSTESVEVVANANKQNGHVPYILCGVRNSKARDICPATKNKSADYKRQGVLLC